MYFSSGSWLTPGIHKTLIAKLTTLSNTILRVIFGKRREEMNTEALHHAANILSPWQQAHYGPSKLMQFSTQKPFRRHHQKFIILQQIGHLASENGPPY